MCVHPESIRNTTTGICCCVVEEAGINAGVVEGEGRRGGEREREEKGEGVGVGEGKYKSSIWIRY